VSFQQYIRWFYYTGLVGIIAGMSISKPGISVGISVCLLAWLLEKDLFERIKSLKNQPFFWISLALVLLHLAGLLWSDNIAYGLKDTKTKLPLLLLPLIFLSSKAFHLKNEMTFIKFIFISSLIVCTLFSFGIYFHWIKPAQYNPADIRTMIFGVSGVRLALFICLALCFLVFDIYHQKKWQMRFLLFGIAVWFLFFLNFIESGTAVVFIIILVAYSFLYIILVRFSRVKQIIVFSLGFLVLVTSGIIFYSFVTSMMVKKPNPVKGNLTKRGEEYKNYTKLPYLENGYVVGNYIAIYELMDAWNKRSDIKIGKYDKKGQTILSTLLRYLNSKGGVKDAEAVENLSQQDVLNIENGVANYHYQHMFGWQKRLMQIVFEFESYRMGLNPFGNSVTQRFEYWKIALNLFSENKIIGIGTGDVKEAYEEAYKKYSFNIDPRFKLRAHNQYLTMAATFGLVGFVLFLLYAFSLVWTKSYKEYPYFTFAFFIIMIFSFLSEDTLETQSGVTFIVFFHTLFHLRSNSHEGTKTQISR
jgi:O-antigen ligase